MGKIALFALQVIRDAFRAPFELAYLVREFSDQGCRSLPLIVSSGLALGFVMTLHTRSELIKFGASAWIPGLQSVAFFVEIGPLVAGLLVAGRVGAAMGASLAEMRATEQIDAIEVLSNRFLQIAGGTPGCRLLSGITPVDNVHGFLRDRKRLPLRALSLAHFFSALSCTSFSWHSVVKLHSTDPQDGRVRVHHRHGLVLFRL